jgi:subtilisin family serine protease
VKVLGRNGSGYLSDVIEGIDYVTANASQIEVANMSLGCLQCQTAAMDTAISRSVAAGVVYAVAAGNDAVDAALESPANHPDVLAVSAIADFNGQPGGGAAATCRPDQDDTFADFSNYGSTVDIAAPGVCILSTYKGGKYAIVSGTSMASPHVAGAAALYIVTHGKPTDAAGVAAVRAALISGGTTQTAPEGFTGDPDAYPEPLVNAEPL